jgi:hypothetical protein
VSRSTIARTVAVPFPVAVSLPADDTATTPVSEDDHAAATPAIAAPWASRAVATSASVSPRLVRCTEARSSVTVSATTATARVTLGGFRGSAEPWSVTVSTAEPRRFGTSVSARTATMAVSEEASRRRAPVNGAPRTVTPMAGTTGAATTSTESLS